MATEPNDQRDGAGQGPSNDQDPAAQGRAQQPAEAPSARIVPTLLAGFAFLSICSFFPNPLFPENEIFPYYLLPALLILAAKNARGFLVLVGGSVTLSGAIIAARGSLDVVATDTLQVIGVGATLYCAASLSHSERVHLARWLKVVVYVVVAFMVLQYVIPSFVDLVYAHLVRRDATAAELEAYTGGVPGVAPEPAYMGSYLIGAWILVRRFAATQSVQFTLACVAGVMMTASLSATLTFAVVLTVVFVTSTRRALYCGLAVATAIVVAFLVDSSLIARVTTLIEVGSSEKSLGVEVLAAIDAAFGSVRLISLVAPLSEFGCGAYFCDVASFAKGYSLFAVLHSLIAPIHLVLGVALVASSRDRLGIASALLAIGYGPVLNWSMYGGLLRGRRADAMSSPGGANGVFDVDAVSDEGKPDSPTEGGRPS